MTDRQTIDVYDSAVESYLAVPMLDSHQAALDGFMSALPKGGQILDLGSGPGVYAEQMLAAGFQVDAVDASPAFVAEAQKRGVPARLGVFDDLPGNALYDGIWASFSLLHAPRDSVASHIARLAASLNPGGLFFLGMKTGTGESRDSLGRFYSYFSIPELQAMLEAPGLILTDLVTGNGKGLSGGDDTYALLTARRDA